MARMAGTLAENPTTAEPPLKRQKLDLSKTITVLVGRDQAFTLHRSVATKTPHFLRAALDNDEEKVNLPEQKPEIFEIYMQWLYSDVVVTACGPAVTVKDTIFETKCSQLMACYIMGRELQDSAFRNGVVDATIVLQRELGFCPGPNAVRQIWPCTPSGCTMQRFILRWALAGWKDYTGDLPNGFLVALLNEHTVHRNAGTLIRNVAIPTFAKRCDYHEHPPGTARCPRRD